MNTQPTEMTPTNAKAHADMRFVSLDGEKLRVYRGDLVEMNLINGFPVTTRRPKPPIQFIDGYYPPAGQALTEDEASDLLDSPLFGKKYALANVEDAQTTSVSSGSAAADVPEGYARINGEVLPLAEAFARMQAAAEGADQSAQASDDLEPIEGVTTKQEALEELAKRGVKSEHLTARDTVDEIIEVAHKAGYCFPSYEAKHD